MPSSRSTTNEQVARMRLFSQGFLATLLVFWAAWFYPFDDLLDRSGTPLGGDFVMLYVAGHRVLNAETDSLYDDQANQQRATALFPALDPTQSWPYRYPPVVALAMAPFARLPYPASFTVYLALLIALGAASVFVLVRLAALPRGPYRQTFVWCALGWPVALEVPIGGQTSMLALCVAVMFLSLRVQSPVLAGAVLGLALYKPNILYLFLIGSIIIQPRHLLGLVPIACCGAALCWATAGSAGVAQYTRLGASLATSAWNLETPLWKVHGLAPWFELLLPAHGRLVAVVLGLCVAAGIAIQARKNQISPNTAFGLLLLANSLFNPYVPIYDLVLLLPAIVLLFMTDQPEGRLVRARAACPTLLITWGFLLIYTGPHASQVLSKAIHVQLFPLVLLVLFSALILSTWKPSIRSPSAAQRSEWRDVVADLVV